MATTTILNDLIDLNQTGNTTALKGCVGTNAQQPADPTISVQYLVVGGGGGGNGSGSGGAGAGAFVAGTVAVPNNTTVNIAVGQGGLGVLSGTDGEPAGQGQDSGFYTIQGQGGGAGVKRGNGSPGGSGAGGGASGATAYTGGSSTAYGNNGGNATSSTTWSTGGGGGAGSVGGGGTVGTAGAGGIGSTTTIISTTNATTANVGEQDGGNLYFAGGGGGGGSDSVAGGNNLGGSGGLGGGGDGTGQCSDCPGGNGTLNTGGGGGGSSAATVDTPGGSGGSGVVILRYANTATETIAGSLAGGITTGTTTDCNYPTTSNGLALYQFSSDATDTCGNYDGTNDSGITYGSPGVFGNGAQFGGGSDRIDINQAILGSGSTKIFSHSFWFLTSNSAEQYFGNTGASGSGSGFGFYLSPTTGYLNFQVANGSGASPLMRYEIDYRDGNWHHVVGVYSSAGGTNDAYMYLYVDGQNVTDLCTAINGWSQGSVTTWNSFTYPRITLGNWANSSSYPGGLYPLIGSMDQVRFFDVALTADQVAMLYAENIGATKFTESSDTVLVFKAGSGTINLTDTSLPGPTVGSLRTNTDQSSNSSASAMEHYMSTGWRVFNNCTTSVCNYPTTASALYQLNDNANDTCGNSNGTFTNPSYVTGKFGNAANFNGSNNYIEVPVADTPSLLVSTVTFWVKTTTTSADGIIGTGYDSGGYWNSFQAYVYGTTGKFVIRYGNGTQEGPALSSTSDVNTGLWVFCAVSFSGSTVGSTIKMYVNGVLETTHTTTVSRVDNTQKGLIMGAYSAAGTIQNWFTGALDQARIFPSVLTASQIEELYNESC